MRDELVGCKDVRIRNVADICPVEEVGVVTNLEVRAALFEDLGEARDSLAVTWSVGEIVLSVVIMWSTPLENCRLTQRCPRDEGQQSVSRQSRWPRGRAPRLLPWIRCTHRAAFRETEFARQR